MTTQIVHIEIPGGSDTTQARAFWGTLFGWQFTQLPGSPAEYFHARINDNQGVAVSSLEPDKRYPPLLPGRRHRREHRPHHRASRRGLRKDARPRVRLVRAATRTATNSGSGRTTPPHRTSTEQLADTTADAAVRSPWRGGQRGSGLCPIPMAEQAAARRTPSANHAAKIYPSVTSRRPGHALRNA